MVLHLLAIILIRIANLAQHFYMFTNLFIQSFILLYNYLQQNFPHNINTPTLRRTIKRVKEDVQNRNIKTKLNKMRERFVTLYTLKHTNHQKDISIFQL